MKTEIVTLLDYCGMCTCSPVYQSCEAAGYKSSPDECSSGNYTEVKVCLENQGCIKKPCYICSCVYGEWSEWDPPDGCSEFEQTRFREDPNNICEPEFETRTVNGTGVVSFPVTVYRTGGLSTPSESYCGIHPGGYVFNTPNDTATITVEGTSTAFGDRSSLEVVGWDALGNRVFSANASAPKNTLASITVSGTDFYCDYPCQNPNPPWCGCEF